MVAGDGQARDHCFAFALGGDLVGRERIAHDAVVDLGIDHPVVERDAGAAVAAACDGFAEPFDDVGVTVPFVSFSATIKPPAGTGPLL